MNKKIISKATETKISEFLKGQLSLLRKGINIFLDNNAHKILKELLLIKKNIDLKKFFGSLHMAVYNRDLNFLLTDKQPKIDKTNPEIEKFTMAQVSIYNCLHNLNEENIQIILQKLAKNFETLGFVHEQSKGYLGTAVLSAAKINDLPGFIQLLQLGADVNHKDTEVATIGTTALIFACFQGYKNIAAELIKVPGIKINEGNAFGNTALMLAVIYDKFYNQDIPTVKMLLEHPDIDVNIRNSEGTTALDIAVGDNNMQVIKELLKDKTQNNLRRFNDKNIKQALKLARGKRVNPYRKTSGEILMSLMYTKIVAIDNAAETTSKNDLLFRRYLLYILHALKNNERLAIDNNRSVLNILAKYKLIVLVTKREYTDKRNNLSLEVTQADKKLLEIKNNIETVKEIKKQLEQKSEGLFYKIFGFILRCFDKYNLEKKIECKNKRLNSLRNDREKATEKSAKAHKEWAKIAEVRMLEDEQITLSACGVSVTLYFRITSLGQHTFKILKHKTALPDDFEAREMRDSIKDLFFRRFLCPEEGECVYHDYGEMENYLKKLLG